MADSNRSRLAHRLLAVIATVVVLWALKWSAAVTLPLAFAVFLLALFWPLQRRLENVMPQGAALLLTLLAFLVALGLFVAAFWFSAEQVAGKAGEYEGQFRQLYEQARQWAEQRGLALPGGGDGGGGLAGRDALIRTGRQVFSFLGAFVLVVAYLVLGLHDTSRYRQRFAEGLPGRPKSDEWLETIHDIARDFQRYFVIRTGTGLATGVLTGLVCWLIGLDFALVWGLLNYLLNYIPTLGSILGVLPPVLFALVQFGFGWQALLVLLGVGGVQLVMGNYVDPLVQGKYLSLSPLVVLVSVALWGWIWGIAGAFLGVPITVAVVVTCARFERTRWLAALLAEIEK